MSTHLYRPKQGTSWAAVRYFGICAVAGLIELFTTGTLFPVLPPGTIFHFLFWFLLAFSPILLLQMGWSYELTETELVLRRFDRERERLPLTDYVSRVVFAAIPRLSFRQRSFFLVSAADADRQAFFHELDRRVRALGVRSGLHVPTRVGKRGLRTNVGDLRFPDACVVCGEAAHGTAKLRAKRGIELGLYRYVQFIDIPVPACDRHRVRHRVAMIGAYVGSFVATLAAWTAWLAFSKGANSEVAAIGGITLAFLVVMVLHALRLARLVDWLALGLRARALSPDLVEVTLEVRSDALRERLLSATATQAVVATFA